MGMRLASGLLAATILAGGLAATPSEASSSDEARSVSLMNGERSSRGIAKLPVSGALTAIARRHSERMAADGRIYHNNALPSQVGGNWKAIGENVGRGGSVDAIHQAFMDSSSHREHILDGRYNEVGVGVAVRDGTIYVTQVFVQRGSAPRPPPRRVSRPARPSRVHHRPPPRPKVVAPPVAPPVAPLDPPAARQVGVLLRLLAHDADVINPATGLSIGV
jgi:cysteine-rich secretory family protein